MMHPWCERPYPEELRHRDWMKVPPHYVIYATLTPTQRGVWIDSLLDPQAANHALPLVVSYEGHLYVEDGHTRLCRAIAAGDIGGYVRLART